MRALRPKEEIIMLFSFKKGLSDKNNSKYLITNIFCFIMIDCLICKVKQLFTKEKQKYYYQ